MSEIDLIPSDYRTNIIKRNIVKQFVIILIATILLTITSYATLGYLTLQLKNNAVVLQKKQAITKQHRSSLIQTQQQQSTLQQQWETLKNLRSGAAVKDMFESIDAALPDKIWFLSWSFQRVGVVQVKAKPKSTNGYFTVIPQDEEIKKPTGTLLQTKMTISGQAYDHSTLSDFVQRLFKQSKIQNVRIVKTSLRRYSTTKVIDFELLVIVNTKLRES